MKCLPKLAVAFLVADNFNVGVKLPVTRADGVWRAHGALAEIKYLAPHRADGFTGAPRSRPATSNTTRSYTEP